MNSTRILKLLAEREYWAIIERKNYFFLQEKREEVLFPIFAVFFTHTQQENARKLVCGTRRTSEQIKKDKDYERIIFCNLWESLSPEKEQLFASIPNQKIDIEKK
jgi:hypothetical protein